MGKINEDRLVNTFLELVGIDCESYFERNIAVYLKKYFERLGISYWEDQASETLKEICFKTLGIESQPGNNIYAYLPGNLPIEQENKEKAILLSAHMDTVHPGKGRRAVRKEDGKIETDGSTVLGADDGTGIAEILEILTILQEESLPHPDIEVIFSPAEEPYCQGSRLIDYSRIQAKKGFVLDLSGEVHFAAYAAPAIYSLYIRVLGKASHAGFAPEEGIHALYIASKAIASLPYGHVEEDTTVNLGTITGGMGKNVVPEEVYLTGEIRSMSQEKAKHWAEEIKRVFELYATQIGGRVEIKIEKEFDAYSLDEEEEVRKIFEKSVRELGMTPHFMQTYGGSDANHYNSHGIKTLVVANAMHEVHSVREYTRVEDMVKACTILLKIIENL